jgi:trk system potassium uptake protein TrkH
MLLHVKPVVDVRAVAGVLGALVFFLGVALLLPMLVGLAYGEASWWGFGVTALVAMAGGGAAYLKLGRGGSALGAREGFAIVALAWLVLSLVGAVPFVLGGPLASYTDAFFETMSGFTTTGATILGGADTPAIEAMPRAHLFWRSLTHWMGGMGVVVLTLAILPFLGVGGMQLFRAEAPGPSADKLTPRIRETARRLWLIYVGLTAVHFALLLPAMPVFEAINHAFSTMATGGFSTLNGSVGQFESAYVDWVVIVFMFLAGANFALHFRLLRGEAITVVEDTELRVYVALIAGATLVILLGTWEPVQRALQPDAALGYDGLGEALRHSLFQSLAIITTTGYATADYELWTPLAQAGIFALFFVGGMAGSTGGGVKVVRVILMLKNSFKEIKQLVHPQALIPIRLGGRVVPPEVMRNVLSFMVLYVGLLGAGTIGLMMCGIDVLGAFSASASSVGNIGPAFGDFGPAETYASVPAAGKWILALLMMAGRLEIFTVLILFVPTFWRR